MRTETAVPVRSNDNVEAARIAADRTTTAPHIDESPSVPRIRAAVTATPPRCDRLSALTKSQACFVASAHDSPLPHTPICNTPLMHASSSLSSAKIQDTDLPAPRMRARSTFSLSLMKRQLANEHEPRYGFLAKIQEGGVSALARAEILLWIKELIQFHECGDDVFVCTADLLDRVLSVTKMKPKHIRVAAVACFLIASKCLLEEADQPLVDDLVANCSPEFSANDLKRMEIVVLSKLDWNLPSRSSLSVVHDLITFVATELLLNESRIVDLVEVVVPKFVACCVSYELLRFKPSEIACGIIVSELSGITRLSEGYLRGLFTELNVNDSRVHDCDRLVARHLRITAAL